MEVFFFLKYPVTLLPPLTVSIFLSLAACSISTDWPLVVGAVHYNILCHLTIASMNQFKKKD